MLEERIAGDLDLGSHQPVQLFAGEAPIITDNFPVGADLEQYEVFALDANGIAVKHAPGAADGTEIAAGIACYAVVNGTDTTVAAYTGGFFNHEALVWEASLDDLAKRKAQFTSTGTIKIGRLL